MSGFCKSGHNFDLGQAYKYIRPNDSDNQDDLTLVAILIHICMHIITVMGT